MEYLAVVQAEVEKVVEQTGLQREGAESLRNAYAPHFQAFDKLAIEANTIKPTEPKKARAMRLELKKVRVAAEHTRKELKADSLRRGKAIDGVYNVLEYGLKPIEDAMESIEKAEEIAEQERQKALIAVRSEELRAIGAEPNFYTLATMSEDQYQKLLGGLKAAKAEAEEKAKRQAEEEAARARAAEEERRRQEAAAAAERERLKAENERLAKIAAEEAAKRAAAEETARIEREAAEAKAREEREAQEERERLAEAERWEMERKAAEDRQRAEKAEKELAAKKEAERKRKAAEEAAAKKAAAAPDKEKLLAVARCVRVFPIPVMATPEGKKLAADFRKTLGEACDWLDGMTNEL